MRRSPLRTTTTAPRGPGSSGRRLAAAALVAGAVAAGTALPASSGAEPADTSRATAALGKAATAQRTSCAKFSRQARTATGKKRQTARRQLADCKAENSANARVLKAVRGSRFVGTRGDGQEEDWTFCADGTYVLRSTSGGSTGVSYGTSWRITDATGKRASTFTAYVADPKEGLEVGIARKNGAWQVGVARSFGEIDDLGPATRTAAPATCPRPATR